MSVLLQISDPHFGTERAPVVAALAELVRRQKPAIVVLSGDITQRARRREFSLAARFVQSLEVAQVLVVPGNHDIPLFNPIARFCAPYARYSVAFGAELEPELESGSFFVLGVNSTRAYRLSDGELSRAQVERVAQRLRAAAPEQLRVVVAHHPLHVIRDRDRKHLVRGHEPAVRAWSLAGADLILGGHLHLPHMCLLSDSLPSLPRKTWSVQAGTAVSRRLRRSGANSINLVRHSPRELACQVERWDYAGEESAFVRGDALKLELERNRDA